VARPTPQEKLLILERRKNVARRYLRGEAQWEIARAFEVAQSTVSEDLRTIREAWLKEALLDFDERQAKELAKIDELEVMAREAYLRSCQDATVLKARMQGSKGTTEKVTKGQAGDPRFLVVILNCINKRCEIFGIQTTPGNVPILIQTLEGVREDEILGKQPTDDDPLPAAGGGANLAPESPTGSADRGAGGDG
jgi:hypothetical protein